MGQCRAQPRRVWRLCQKAIVVYAQALLFEAALDAGKQIGALCRKLQQVLVAVGCQSACPVPFYRRWPCRSRAPEV
jgi:hypothetical protein